MIIPVLCFSCGKLLAHRWEEYQEKLQEEFSKLITNYDDRFKITDAQKSTVENRVLTEMGITKYCCRRMFLGNVDLCEKI